jgi:hypothetical protein
MVDFTKAQLELRRKYENLIEEGNANPDSVHTTKSLYTQIRYLILMEGLPITTIASILLLQILTISLGRTKKLAY